MGRYRKKPVEVEAVRFDGENVAEVQRLATDTRGAVNHWLASSVLRILANDEELPGLLQQRRTGSYIHDPMDGDAMVFKIDGMRMCGEVPKPAREAYRKKWLAASRPEIRASASEAFATLESYVRDNDDTPGLRSLIEQEKARRNAHTKVRQAIDQLPQLFIAV